MLSPQLNVCMSVVAKNSYLVTVTKDEYVGLGSYRVLKRGVIQLSPSEYFMLKSAFGVVDAAILGQNMSTNPNIRGTKLATMKRKLAPLIVHIKKRPPPIELPKDCPQLPTEVLEILAKMNVDKIWFFRKFEKTCMFYT